MLRFLDDLQARQDDGHVAIVSGRTADLPAIPTLEALVDVEILHDTGAASPYEWQPIGDLARNLGIAERTVRHRLASGLVEKMKGPDRRVYYRAVREAMDKSDGHGNGTADLPAMVEELSRLRTELVQAHRENAATVADLREALVAASVAAEAAKGRAEVAEVLADVAVRDLEQTKSNLADQRDAALALVATERQRTRLLARANRLPWWAFRRRRDLLVQADELELPLALPSVG